jgi:hypothetical protein
VRSAKEKEPLRTARGNFHVGCTSVKNPESVLTEVQRVMHLFRVQATSTGAWVLHCAMPRVRFEAEVAHLDDMKAMYVVQFRRIAGEQGRYQEIVQALIAKMQL